MIIPFKRQFSRKSNCCRDCFTCQVFSPRKNLDTIYVDVHIFKTANRVCPESFYLESGGSESFIDSPPLSFSVKGPVTRNNPPSSKSPEKVIDSLGKVLILYVPLAPSEEHIRSVKVLGCYFVLK